MSRKHLKAVLGIALASGLLFTAGCGGAGGGGGGAGASDAPAGGGDGLNVLMVGNPQMKDIEKLAPQYFTEETGIKVNFTILPENELRDKVAQDIATQAGQYDVVTIGAYEGSTWTQNDWLLNMQEKADADAEFDAEDILPAMKGVVAKDGDMYGIPFYGESSMTMYRKDIFETHGLTMPDEPTWTQIRELAVQLKAAEPEISPICMRGLPGWGENMAVVGSMINAFGGQWLDKDYNPMFTPDGGAADAIRFYVDLVQNYGQTGAPNAGFTEVLNTFSQGNCAMWYDATSAAASVESPEASTVVGKVGYADAPREEIRSGWVWAWAWAVPKTTKNVDDAWKFISWASGKGYERTAGENLGWTKIPDGKRTSTFEIPEYKEASAAYSQVTLNAIEASDPQNCAVAPNPAPGCQYLAVPEFADFGAKIGQEVSAAVAGQKSVDDALATSQKLLEDVSAKKQ